MRQFERVTRSDVAVVDKPGGPVRRGMRRARRWLSRHRRLERGYRIGIAIIGTLLALGGLVMVPLPGPGWLVVFAGLALLGTEFVWAHRLNLWLKRTLARFWAWWHARRAARRAARVAAADAPKRSDAAADAPKRSVAAADEPERSDAA
ncbi:TIGR02611 family protein [Microbacterium protaetiae]|uniref:TIGR02611 family protein n=1 Tax=Microbacterium protaetiae TaxID=2509458 RepID=A0A4P6EEQ0_9MICO|nr:TIGR02611 family protein [Microbacterium protaetiae]QAY59863.1 TIGR02611 family protein [Microbacterium protaetiae]